MLLLFTGCSSKVSLHQPVEEIVRIDFLYSPFNEFEVLKTLSIDEISACIEDILQMNIHRNSSPSAAGGTYIVKITYSDGAVEFLGSWSVSYTYGEVTEHDGWYFISEDDLHDLFAKYINSFQIPSP